MAFIRMETFCGIVPLIIANMKTQDNHHHHRCHIKSKYASEEEEEEEEEAYKSGIANIYPL
jgi:hypothetical protein